MAKKHRTMGLVNQTRRGHRQKAKTKKNILEATKHAEKQTIHINSDTLLTQRTKKQHIFTQYDILHSLSLFWTPSRVFCVLTVFICFLLLLGAGVTYVFAVFYFIFAYWSRGVIISAFVLLLCCFSGPV